MYAMKLVHGIVHVISFVLFCIRLFVYDYFISAVVGRTIEECVVYVQFVFLIIFLIICDILH